METEWHSIPLEDTSRTEGEYCFHFTEEKQSSQQARNRELSMCVLSKSIGTDGNDETRSLVGYTASSKEDDPLVSMHSSDAASGGNEVRLSFHGLEDTKNGSESVVYEKGSRLVSDSGSILAYEDEGCLRLLHQVRAFVKGAKLSCSGLLSGDHNRTFLSGGGWGSLLDRSFSFKSSDASSSPDESESLGKKSNCSALARTVSTPPPTRASVVSSGGLDASMAGGGPLQARDPQSRAAGLPLAHYRPTDGAVWKEEEGTAAQPSPPAALCKSPGHINCKKPPRHPGRSASLDSASLVAQRSARRKSKDKASAKRKGRRTSSAAASTGITPLVALVLTIGFGVLMIFHGVFGQTNVSYGRNTDRAVVDVAGNLRSSLSAQRSVAHGYPNRIDTQLSNVDVSKSEAVLSEAFRKAMEELPRSRSSLTSQIKSPSG